MYGFVFVRVCSVVYTEYKITVGPRPFPYQNTGMTNQTHPPIHPFLCTNF